MSRRGPEAYERFKHNAERPMLVASLLFVPVVVLPLVTDLTETADDVLTTMAWIIWGLFAAEYLTLLYLSPSRRHMVRTHILELLIVVLPFLRPVWAARAQRLLKVFAVTGRLWTASGLVRHRGGDPSRP